MSGLLIAMAAGGVAAQNAPEAPNGPDGRAVAAPAQSPGRVWQAPVGHRQPRLSDVPPAPAAPPDDAKADADPQNHIDDRLRICRGC